MIRNIGAEGRVWPVILLLLILQMAAGLAVAREVKTYKNATVVKVFFKGKMSSEQSAVFSQWTKSGAYFGALAILPGSDIALGVEGFSDPEVAAKGIEAACQEVVKQERLGGTCVLVAATYPSGFRSSDTKKETLSFKAGQAFLGKYKQNQKQGKFGAFAVTGVGAVGYSWGSKSQSSAEKRALRECRKRQSKRWNVASLGNMTAALAGNATGGLECRVIHVTLP